MRDFSLNHVLISQLAKFGDIIQTIPLIKGLRTRHKGCSLHLLIPSTLSHLAENIKEIDHVIGVDIKSLRRGCLEGKINFSEKIDFVLKEMENLHKSRISYKTVYNLNRSTISSLILSLMDTPNPVMNRLAFDMEVVSTNEAMVYLLTTTTYRKLHRINLIDIFLLGADLTPGNHILSYCTSSKVDDEALDVINILENAKGNGKKIAAIQPGAGVEHRRWPIPYYAEVSDSLNESGYEVIVLGTKDEKEYARSMKELTKLGFTDATGRTSFSSLATILSYSDILITNDTGTMHLGASVGTKVVSIFLSTAYPYQTGPYGKGHIVLHPDLDCYPCLDGNMCKVQTCRNSVNPEDLTLALEGKTRQNSTSKVFITNINDEGFELLPLNKKKDYTEHILGKTLKRAILFLAFPSRYPLKKGNICLAPEISIKTTFEREKIENELTAIAKFISILKESLKEGNFSTIERFKNCLPEILSAFLSCSIDEAVRRNSLSNVWINKRIDDFLKASIFVKANLEKYFQ